MVRVKKQQLTNWSLPEPFDLLVKCPKKVAAQPHFKIKRGNGQINLQSLFFFLEEYSNTENIHRDFKSKFISIYLQAVS